MTNRTFAALLLLGVAASACSLQTADAGDPSLDQAAAAPTASGTFTALPKLPGGARQEHAVVALRGEIYVIGGFDDPDRVLNTVEVFSPAQNRWRTAAAVPSTMHHVNAAVVGDAIYIVGFLADKSFRASGAVLQYDATADRWTQIATMPAGTERGASGVGVIDGKIYVVGGARSLRSVATVSSFDPATKTFTTLPSLPEAREHMAVGVVGSSLYVLGGRANSVTGFVPRTVALEAGATSWKTLAPIPTPRGGLAGAVLDGRIYLFGGEGDSSVPSGVFNRVDLYDPAADRWQALGPMDTARHGYGAAVLDGRIYLPGGGIHMNHGPTDVASYYSLGAAP